MKIFKKPFLGIVLIALNFNILAQVGIGTSNPHASAALEIQSTSKGFLFPRMTKVARDAISNIATGLTIYCTDCGTSGEGVLQVYNASNWEDLNDFVSASTGGMFTEKVGIGTIGTTPIYALDVDANNKGSSTYSARFTNSAPGDGIYNILLFTQGESDTAIGYLGTGGSNVLNEAFRNNFVVGTKNNTPLVLNTNDSERMRIDTSGNLLVGLSSISANPNQGYGVAISVSGSYGNIKTVGNGSHTHFTVVNAANVVGSITSSASATAYNTSSDQRLKKNIADADDAGSKIDAIQVRKYDWKADGSHQDYGMIAQELQAVAPEAVSGDADSEDMMGVDYSKLVPMLIKEIQSLRNRVAQLETGE